VVIGALSVALYPAFDNFEGCSMTLHEEIKAPGWATSGALAPAGKISRFTATGDKPARRTGFAVSLADGDLLLSSAHPHSTFILHGHGLVRGLSHGG
jgi:hypothetical protein